MIFEEVSTLSDDDIQNRIDKLNSKIGIAPPSLFEQMFMMLGIYQRELDDRMYISEWNKHRTEFETPLESDTVQLETEKTSIGTRPERKRVRIR